MRYVWFFALALFLFAPANAEARSLYYDFSGDDVRELQRKLITHGYLAPGYATGYFGTLTQTAIRKFQCDHNIVCSGTTANGYGVYGPQTQAMFATVTDYSTDDPATLDGQMTPPATGGFEVSGWVPYWRSATGTADTLPYLSKLTSVMPFGYTMKTNGTLADTAGLTEDPPNGEAGPWTSFIKAAREEDVYVVPSVMWGSGETIHTVLRNTDKRIALEDEIAATVMQNNFDGIDIDFEAKKHETIWYFSTFLKGLYQRMGNKWVYCTVEARMPLEHRFLPGTQVPPDATNRANDYGEMKKYCDRVEIMAYDQGRVDQKLNSEREHLYAPVADPEWVESLVRLAAQTIERNKIIIGIPTYGYGYKVYPLEDGDYHYQRLWAFNPQYALDIAEKLGIEPARTSAGELGFTYDGEEWDEIKEDEDHKSPQRADRDAWEEMETGEPFYFVTWSDAEAIEDKIKLAHELGVRGVAFFKFDGGQDSKMWDLLE